MPRHTTTRGLPWYEGEDAPRGDIQQHDLADILEAGFASITSGAPGDRGAAGTARRLFISTDGSWSYDNGTAWQTFRSPAQIISHQLTYGGPVDPTWGPGDLAGYVVPVLSGTVRLVGVTLMVHAGTGRVDLTVRRSTGGGAATAITGLGTTGEPLAVTAGAAPQLVLLATPQIVTVANLDVLTPTIVSTTGAPQGLDVGLLLERST